MTTIIVFEDEHVARLYPVTLGRPGYAISCGSFRLLDWLKRLERPIVGVVRPHLAQIQALDYPELRDVSASDSEQLIFVNSRLVPSRTTFEALRKIAADARPGVCFRKARSPSPSCLEATRSAKNH